MNREQGTQSSHRREVGTILLVALRTRERESASHGPLLLPVSPLRTHPHSPMDPDVVRTLLGDAGSSHEFSEWLRSAALISQGPLSAVLVDAAKQPYELLAERHLAMDVERYLQVTDGRDLRRGERGTPSTLLNLTRTQCFSAHVA